MTNKIVSLASASRDKHKTLRSILEEHITLDSDIMDVGVSNLLTIGTTAEGSIMFNLLESNGSALELIGLIDTVKLLLTEEYVHLGE